MNIISNMNQSMISYLSVVVSLSYLYIVRFIYNYLQPFLYNNILVSLCSKLIFMYMNDI